MSLHELQLRNKQLAAVFVAVPESECASMTGSSRATGMRNVVFVVSYLYPVGSGLEIRVDRSVQLNQMFQFSPGVFWECTLTPYRSQRIRVHCTYLLTYLLAPWCRVLLEKLTGLQLVKKLPAFYGTRRFITALTRVRHLSLSWANPIQSTYPHPTS